MTTRNVFVVAYNNGTPPRQIGADKWAWHGVDENGSETNPFGKGKFIWFHAGGKLVLELPADHIKGVQQYQIVDTAPTAPAAPEFNTVDDVLKYHADRLGAQSYSLESELTDETGTMAALRVSFGGSQHTVFARVMPDGGLYLPGIDGALELIGEELL